MVLAPRNLTEPSTTFSTAAQLNMSCKSACLCARSLVTEVGQVANSKFVETRVHAHSKTKTAQGMRELGSNWLLDMKALIMFS